MTSHPHTHHFPNPTHLVWGDMDIDAKKQAITALGTTTPAEIADILGTTRDAVQGFIFRHGLSQRPTDEPRQPLKDIGPDGGLPASTWQAPNPIPWITAPENACRWPIGDDAKLCCGEPKAKGSYCAHHAARAYVAPRGTPMPVADMPWGRSINRRDHRALVHGGKAQRYGGGE